MGACNIHEFIPSRKDAETPSVEACLTFCSLYCRLLDCGMPGLTPDFIRRCFSSSTNRRILSLPNYTRAAVLLPLVARSESFDLLLTKRTEMVETHKGQVSFPGGMVDSADADIIQTALRETQEELGLAPSAVEAVGLLDDIATPTRFVITPVVGIVHRLPCLSPNRAEVAEVFCVPLEFFMRPDTGRSEVREVAGRTYEVWFYQYDTHLIWGATATIIRLLLRTLNVIPPVKGMQQV